MKTLIVNENPILLEALTRLLQKEDYEIIRAENGLEAHQLFLEEEPELIILDLLLSYMTAYEFIEIVKAKSISTQIIVLTSVGLSSVIEEVFELGVDDFMMLPLKQKELLARIKRLERTQAPKILKISA